MSKKVVKITVSPEEAGQKLLAFLQRNLKNPSTGVPLPKSLLHRLVRSGQVRINGKRSTPFNTLEAGNEVRIPPLDGINLLERSNYLQKKQENEARNEPDLSSDHFSSCPNALPSTNPNVTVNANFSLSACLQKMHPNLPILAESADYIIFNKPAGLPVHPGSRQPDSLISWVHACAPAGQTFLPTLAHRLDKATSGILLVAKSYRFLRAVQDALAAANEQEGGLKNEQANKKEYLAWVQGVWNEEKASQKSTNGWQLLEDWLEKRQGENGSYMEKVESIPQRTEQNFPNPTFCPEIRPEIRPNLCPNLYPELSRAAHSLCRVKAIGNNKYATLMRIQLLTGRTHQIRVQLASRGHPIIGDRKYGGPACKQGMLLHSFHFCLANWPEQNTKLSFECLPSWQAPYAVNSFISCSESDAKEQTLPPEY